MLKLPQAPKTITPLWMMFLFFSFAEIVLGFVVSQTTGGVQVSLTVFVILFTTFVTVMFFIILWNRPEHLYAPKDYGSDEAYQKSMTTARKSRSDLYPAIDKEIITSLTSEPIIQKLISVKKEDELRVTLKDTAAQISHEIRESNFFTVSFKPISDQPDLIFPIDAFSDFNEFTDEVYFSFDIEVEPYTYGTSWILRDKATGKIFKHARMISGVGPGRMLKDDRTLKEMGIKGGMILEVIRPS